MTTRPVKEQGERFTTFLRHKFCGMSLANFKAAVKFRRNFTRIPFMSVKPIPDGYASVTPYLIINGAAQAIDFYKKVFNARERMRMPKPGGKIGHAEIEIGGSVIMLADENPEYNAKGPQTIGGTPVTIHVYVANVDEVYARAVAAGATQLRPVKNQFYGDRSGGFSDPFGHSWYVATHVEDVSEEELQRRMAAMGK